MSLKQTFDNWARLQALCERLGFAAHLRDTDGTDMIEIVDLRTGHVARRPQTIVGALSWFAGYEYALTSMEINARGRSAAGPTSAQGSS